MQGRDQLAAAKFRRWVAWAFKNPYGRGRWRKNRYGGLVEREMKGNLKLYREHKISEEEVNQRDKSKSRSKKKISSNCTSVQRWTIGGRKKD